MDIREQQELMKFLWLVPMIGIVVISIIMLTNRKANEKVVERTIDSQTAVTVDVVETPMDIEPEAEIMENELEDLINGWVADEPGDFSVVVQEIGGQSSRATYDETVDFISASTYKLFVSYVLLQEIEAGNLDYTSITSLGRTLDDCFDSLLTYSWDICAYPMGELVGWDELQARLVSSGFIDTDINNYDAIGQFTGDKHTTAKDMALLMQLLATGELLGKTETDYFLNFLKNQQWRERIPAGVPKNIDVADKPGWIYAYQNDAAIVYGEDVTYVLVILSNNSSTERIANLSSLIYGYFHPNLTPLNSGQAE